MATGSEQKFRPYFTAAEMDYLISCLKSSSSPNLTMIRYLETFKLKIEAGIVTASLIIKPSIEQSLGLDEDTNRAAVLAETTARNLYEIWSLNPNTRATMNPKQLGMIQEYRYLNDLMTPSEEFEYETLLAKSS